MSPAEKTAGIWNGQEYDFTAGQCAFIPPGHDAYVVGDEHAIAIDWAELAQIRRLASGEQP